MLAAIVGVVVYKRSTSCHQTLAFKTLDDFARYIAIPYDQKISAKDPKSITEDVLNKAFVTAERWWNEGTRTYSKKSQFSEINVAFQPQSATPYFELPTFLADRSKVLVVKADPSKEIETQYLIDKKVLFPVHPEIIDDTTVPYLAELKQSPTNKLKAIPTASARSVAEDDICQTCHVDDHIIFHSIKLHLPRKISRFYRNLGPKTITHSVTISKMLSGVDFDKFAYLPESLGISFPTEGDKRGWGFIVREMTPRPYVQEKRLLIPFFALYAQNPVDRNCEPLLVTLARNSKEDPKEFVLNRIIYPLIECWIRVFKQFGVVMESHGQNTLLEIGQNMLPTRIVHRDFDNYVDCELRKKLGLPCEDFHPDQIVKVTQEKPKGSPYSLIFDSSIGHHMLDYVAKTMDQYFGIKPEVLHEAAQKFFKDHFPEFKEYFPPTIYYYADKPSSPNTFPLIDTKEKPRWRPTY